MRRVSVTYLLLGVGLSSLLWPLGSLLLLQIIDPYLIAQTERELGAQATLVAELYRSARASEENVPLGDPRPPGKSGQTFVPPEVRLRDPDAVAPALPDSLPTRHTAIPEAYARLSTILQNAQIFNLSGVRVLDETGCALASSRQQLGVCFGSLPEVQAALSGVSSAALRLRKSDEPTPPVGSMRRRGDRRVFVARPVFQDGKIWGVIWLSRTSESSLEFLYKERRGLLFGAGFVLLGLGVSTWFFARRIVAPLRLMESRIDAPEPDSLAKIDAPREVHALGVAIDQLTARLLDRERYIRQFAENVSHELKTPLTSIHGAVELLALHSDMPRKQVEVFLANIQAATERTTRLVDRLLDLARLENPDLPAKPESLVSMAEFLTQFSVGFGPELEIVLPKGATGPELPRPDLHSLVQNLVENALRVRRTAPVVVELSCDERSAYLSVRDDGPGIDESLQSQLFERFFTTERDRGGTGLGLAIVRAIAARHGGEVSFSSSGKGTEMRVRLPLHA